MSIVREVNKKSGVVYIYSSESYYRPDKKRCFYKRKLLGKLDPSTGELVPTGPRGRPRKNIDASVSALKSEAPVDQAQKESSDGDNKEDVKRLTAECASLEQKTIAQQAMINSLQAEITKYRHILDDFMRNLQKAGITGVNGS